MRRYVVYFGCLLFLGLTAACGGEDSSDPTTEPDSGMGDTFSDTNNPMDEGCVPSELPAMNTERIRSDDAPYFNKAVHMTQAPGQPDTWYIVEREGRIQVVRNGQLLDTPFLDLGSRVHWQNYGEKGFLGLAFHPDYQQNGRFFVQYMTGEDPPDEPPYRSVIAEYRVENTDPSEASPQRERELLNIENPKQQHNGGTLQFGPDGYLYSSHGNGGDMEQFTNQGIGNAQLTSNVLGSIMRFDVDRPDADFAAENNPFVGTDGDDRIFVYGLRNPWRYSFDSETGDMYIADVGKQTIEEINVVPAGENGLNFGWPAYEGTQDGPNTDAKSAIDDHSEPIFEYIHQSEDALIRGGRSIAGGYVYRGDDIPALRGYYVFTDTFSDDVAAILYCDSNDPDAQPEIVDKQRLGVAPPRTGARAFATDAQGELYMIGRDEALQLKPAQ